MYMYMYIYIYVYVCVYIYIYINNHKHKPSHFRGQYHMRIYEEIYEGCKFQLQPAGQIRTDRKTDPPLLGGASSTARSAQP